MPHREFWRSLLVVTHGDTWLPFLSPAPVSRLPVNLSYVPQSRATSAAAAAMLDAGVSLRDVQIAARHADLRPTMRYDQARNKPRPPPQLHCRRLHGIRNLTKARDLLFELVPVQPWSRLMTPPGPAPVRSLPPLTAACLPAHGSAYRVLLD
jgi:hypothetical protein